MRKMIHLSAAIVTIICASTVASLQAAEVKMSIGIRETGGAGPVFSDAGTANGIEWVNRDGQALELDGTWQLFTFTPTQDTLLAFAGSTANSILDELWGSIEHIRILNSDAITDPIRLWIDDVSNTGFSGSVTESFEAYATGAEVMFQEPGFSGSTAANILPGNTSAVTDSEAFSGDQAYQVDFRFVDGLPTRWVRLTTFNANNLPNPAVNIGDLGPFGGAPPTISFWAKGVVAPEAVPDTGSTTLLLAIGCAALGLLRKSVTRVRA